MMSGWATKTLADVSQIKPPKAEARRLLVGTDLVSFVPMEDLGINLKVFSPTQQKPLDEVTGSYTYFADGDVLLAKITPCFENGKLGIATNLTNGVGFGSSEYIVFRPDKSLDKEWLYYFLSQESFRKENAERMSGAVGHKRVSKEFIESYPIPVPPLPEQRRIVEILDEAFDGIATAKANAEQNLQNARALFESHLHSVFTQRGEGWLEKKLGELCSIGDGNYSSKYPKASEFLSSGIPFLTATNLKEGTIKPQDVRYISHEQHSQLTKGHVQTGDLVIVVRGSSTGNSSIVPHDFNGSNLNSQLAFLRSKGDISDRFLFYSFNSPPIQKIVKNEISGAAQPQLPNNKLLDISICYPPVEEQQNIVSKLNELKKETQRLESIHVQKLSALDALKKSLLDQAFTGEL